MTPTAPTSVVAVNQALTSPVVANEEPAISVSPIPPVAAIEPANPNCSEPDPKRWIGFSYRVQSAFVQMWNHSTCDRLVTWRAFNVISDSVQPPLGDAVITIVPAGAMDWRIDVHFYGGVAACGSTVQTDGRAGYVPDMTHHNASFPPGVLFPQPACIVVPNPGCIDIPGPWRKITLPGVPGTVCPILNAEERIWSCSGRVERTIPVCAELPR